MFQKLLPLPLPLLSCCLQDAVALDALRSHTCPSMTSTSETQHVGQAPNTAITNCHKPTGNSELHSSKKPTWMVIRSPVNLCSKVTLRTWFAVWHGYTWHLQVKLISNSPGAFLELYPAGSEGLRMAEPLTRSTDTDDVTKGRGRQCTYPGQHETHARISSSAQEVRNKQPADHPSKWVRRPELSRN